MTQEEFQEQVLARFDRLERKMDEKFDRVDERFAHLAAALVKSGTVDASDFGDEEGLTMKSWNPEE